MTCTVNHLLIELGVSRRKEGREIMEQPALREQHLQADLDSAHGNYARVSNALDTAVRLKLKAQEEVDRLRATNAKLLSALVGFRSGFGEYPNHFAGCRKYFERHKECSPLCQAAWSTVAEANK